MATHNGNQQGGVHFSGEAQEHGRAQRRTSQPQPARRRSAQQGQATRPKQAGTAGSTGSVRLANSQTGRVAQGARGTASKGGAVRQPKAASRQQASSHAASQGASRPQQRTQQRPTGTTRSARPVSAEARSARPSAGSTKATRPVSGATGAVRPVKAARPSQAVRTTPAVGAAHAAQPQAKARRNAPGKHAAPQKKNSYSRRAVVVTFSNGVSSAASINGMPHGASSITDNNMDGHTCIHFEGSHTHQNDNLDPEHQKAVANAASTSLSELQTKINAQ